MLSPSYSNYSLNEQHYLFLSRSLNDLERLVERHRAEQYLIFDRLIKAGFMEPQIERQEMRRYHHLARPISSGSDHRIEQRQEQETQRYRFHSPMSTSFPDPSNNRYQYGRSLSTATAEPGTKENPIYVLDDDDVQCEVCNEEGPFIVDCTMEYQSDDCEEQVRTTGTTHAGSDVGHLR